VSSRIISRYFKIANPFNPSTIKFEIPDAVAECFNTRLIIYDMLGNEIETPIDKRLPVYEINFDASAY
jgi:hypothetical protein